MQNQYYTNRHYEETNNIQNSVCKMNNDIRELSNYCDMLEEQIEKFVNIINESIEILLKYNDNESNYYVPVDKVLNILKGSAKNE